MTALQREDDLTSGNGRIVPFKMAHLVFQCADRQTVVEWYRKLFQADLVFEDEVLTFLTFDEEHHRLAFFNKPELASKQDAVVGVHHIAYSYRSIGDLLSTYDRLKPLGILPVWSINHGPTTSLYFSDPEGNNIELQVDNFPDQSDAAAFFKTEIFANNPIGIEFDPDEMVAMWRNGATDAQLCALGTAATGQSLGPQKR
ncbi:VOC family protein [Pseudomonas sp. P8_241]|jgi:catechol 2,3-dioxygenase-like lactoylglutathione lyase family enzyme|uniref:VOC family protein n=1 Tax=Pseudomonas sp. P8_241 TaxID=3043445 RepID=UPI002A36FAB3|nr:VOC family protein [Pseudomonas sp. P8_241]WPN44560.1 VOC family protein [Pseudomonas sp. P8_241]